MAIRETMVDLVARLRTAIADPAGEDATFSDEDLQEFLDTRRVEHRYLLLAGLPTVQPGGAITFTEYSAGGLQDWEADGVLYGSSYTRVEPQTSDWRRGRWTFATHQPPPLWISGKTYDLAAAGADVLEAWAARLKTEGDLRTGDYAFTRLPRIQAMLALARELRWRQRATRVVLRRSDLC